MKRLLFAVTSGLFIFFSACQSSPSLRKMNERIDLCEAQYASSSWTERQNAVNEVATYKIPRAQIFLLRAINDDNPAVRIDAMRGIQLNFHQQTSPLIFSGIAQSDSSLKVRLEAINILTSYRTPESFPVFVDAFSKDDWLFREAAIKGIASIEDKNIEMQSIPYLIKAIRDPDQNVKIAALTSTRIKDPLIYEEIRQLFYEKGYEKKVTLLTASLTALKGYDLDIRLRERVRQLIIHDNEEVRVLALRVLKSEPAYKKK